MSQTNGDLAAERRPMPAYRAPEARATAIKEFVATLLRHSPELFDDVSRLTVPPPPDQRAIDSGYGPFGHDYARNTWNRLATDVVATEEEIREAYGLLHLNSRQNGNETHAGSSALD